MITILLINKFLIRDSNCLRMYSVTNWLRSPRIIIFETSCLLWTSRRLMFMLCSLINYRLFSIINY